MKDDVNHTSGTTSSAMTSPLSGRLCDVINEKDRNKAILIVILIHIHRTVHTSYIYIHSKSKIEKRIMVSVVFGNARTIIMVVSALTLVRIPTSTRAFLMPVSTSSNHVGTFGSFIHSLIRSFLPFFVSHSHHASAAIVYSCDDSLFNRHPVVSAIFLAVVVVNLRVNRSRGRVGQRCNCRRRFEQYHQPQRR